MSTKGFIDPTTGVMLNSLGVIFVTTITDPDGMQKTQGVYQTELSCNDNSSDNDDPDKLYVGSPDFLKVGTWTITSKARWADENGTIFETKSNPLTVNVRQLTVRPDNATGEWKTSYIVGKFSKFDAVLVSNPEKPDQIFKVHYRVSNGTVNNFSTTAPTTVVAIVDINADNNGDDNGLLEIKFPRNYPYTDAPIDISAGHSFAFFTGDPDEHPGVPTYVESTTTDCFYVFSIPFTSKLKVTMVGTSLLTGIELHGDNVPVSCISDTMVSNVPHMKDGTISPYQQIKAGVTANDISCKEDLELVLNPKGKPCCATPPIAEMLHERWYKSNQTEQ